MLKKVIKYTNAFGEERERTAFFSMTQEELIRFRKDYGSELDGLPNEEDIQNAEEVDFDSIALSMDMVKTFVRTAYFETDADGETYDKSEEAKDRFMNSLAGIALMEELLSEKTSVNDFMRGVTSHIKNAEFQKALSSSGVIG